MQESMSLTYEPASVPQVVEVGARAEHLDAKLCEAEASVVEGAARYKAAWERAEHLDAKLYEAGEDGTLLELALQVRTLLLLYSSPA